jgi:hypothetical protein
VWLPARAFVVKQLWLNSTLQALRFVTCTRQATRGLPGCTLTLTLQPAGRFMAGLNQLVNKPSLHKVHGWRARTLPTHLVELVPVMHGTGASPYGRLAQPRGALQVQVQVCFTSVCGQVQPLDVALSNSV